MADKKQHIDPQLVDKGWASMQETLDREMPEKKRRRILFFYWVGGMASVAAAAMLLWPGASASPDMPFNSTNQTTSANKPTSELPKQDSPKLPIEQTHSIVEQQPATSGISSPTAENKPAASAYAFKPLPKASTFLSPIQTQTTQPKRILYNPEQFQAITPLEIEIAGLEISDAPAEDLSDLALITPVKKAGSIRFGMYAKGMLETQFRESAVSSGFLMDAGLGNRFGIQTGIGYQYALLPGDNRPIVDISGREYLNITGDSSGLAISYQSGGFGLPSLVVEDGTVLLPVNRQHRFEFPLQAYFKVKSRFKVLAGAQFQYTFFSQNNGNSLSLAQNKVNTYESNQLYAEDLNQAVSEKTRGWASRWNAGLGYRLTDRIELQAGVQGNLSLDKLGANSDAEALVHNDPLLDSQTQRRVNVPNYSLYLNANYFFR